MKEDSSDWVKMERGQVSAGRGIVIIIVLVVVVVWIMHGLKKQDTPPQMVESGHIVAVNEGDLIGVGYERYPGSSELGYFEANVYGGSRGYPKPVGGSDPHVFSTEDSPEKVVSYYEQKGKAAGLTVRRGVLKSITGLGNTSGLGLVGEGQGNLGMELYQVEGGKYWVYVVWSQTTSEFHDYLDWAYDFG